MIRKKTFELCLGLSIALHLTFLAAAMIIKMPGMQYVEKTGKHFFNLKSVDKDDVFRPVRKRGTTYAQGVKFQKPNTGELSKAVATKDLETIEKKAASHKDDLKGATKLKELSTAEKSDILDSGKTEELIAQKEVRYTRKELVGSEHIKNGDMMVLPGEAIETAAESGDFSEKMPGFTPGEKRGAIELLKNAVASGFAKSNLSVISKKSRYTNIEEYLICDLETYTDPSDGQKYFKIAVRAGEDADKLPRMPKEILFIIDCSLSIQHDRLEQFKQGVDYCLKNLNKDDVFNVVAFKERVLWFSPRSIRPEAKNMKQALDFIDKLTSDERTDAYKALYDTVTGDVAMVPSYVVFFSDGRPTQGVTNSRKIVNEISKVNNGRRPIFAFSGGARVNRYFLDFISYKNRGWTEYSDRTHFIAKNISKLYDKIRDPLLLNLRYNVSGLDYSEMAPKLLPDFYRNAEFAIYGKYSGEDEFSLQLLGEIEKETNEFTIIGALSEATKGGKDIARNWAFNRIYHLISLLEYGGDNSQKLEEIDRLCEKFGIKTPYSEDIKS